MTEFDDNAPEATLGGRLRLARSPWSRNDLAEKLSCGYQTLRRYEEGERDPPASVLLKICRLRNINIQWLLEGAGPMRRGRYGAPGTAVGGLAEDHASRPPAGPVDADLLAAIILFVDEVMQEQAGYLQSPGKAALYPDIYNTIVYQRARRAPGHPHDDLAALRPLIVRAFDDRAE